MPIDSQDLTLAGQYHMAYYNVHVHVQYMNMNISRHVTPFFKVCPYGSKSYLNEEV